SVDPSAGTAAFERPLAALRFVLGPSCGRATRRFLRPRAASASDHSRCHATCGPAHYTSGPRSARRGLILGLALAVGVGLSACGPTSEENDGVYVDAGPITYQLQVSRQLNQYAVEDRQYLAGLPTGEGHLTPSELWFGVFLWAKNQTDQYHPTSDNFKISDTN